MGFSPPFDGDFEGGTAWSDTWTVVYVRPAAHGAAEEALATHPGLDGL
jgi:hypothetical protein